MHFGLHGRRELIAALAEESCDSAQKVAAVRGRSARPGGEGICGRGDGGEGLGRGGALVGGCLVCGGGVERIDVVDY